MADPQVSQFALAAITGYAESPMRISQFAMVALIDYPVAPIEISQLALVAVIGDNGRVMALGDPIGLGCWSPCQNLAMRLTQIGE